VNVISAGSLRHALEIRGSEKVITFAGGTDLMVRKKSWPGTLPAFDLPVLLIGGLSELMGCSVENGLVRIGAAEKLAAVAENTGLPEILRLAVRQMAAPGIRNMGTIGGNIINASPAGDTLPALYALNTTLTLLSLSGTREVPIRQFIKGPGRTELHDDELLTAVNIPAGDFKRVYYRKIGTRKADALSKVSFAGLANLKEGKIADMRIAIGAVAPAVVRSEEAESLLIGRDIEDVPGLLPEVIGFYLKLIRPIDDQRSNAAYRKEVSLRLIKDFISGLTKK